MSEIEAFASVWDALEDAPEAAAHMRLRSDLMIALQETIDRWTLHPASAAKRLDLTRQRLGELRRGLISQFGLDELLTLADKAGLTIEVRLGAAAE